VKESKPHIKSASVAKEPKPNYHFLRERNEKPFTPTEQRAFNFGRFVNSSKPGSTFGPKLNLRE
jgi:hypothetical protein